MEKAPKVTTSFRENRSTTTHQDDVLVAVLLILQLSKVQIRHVRRRKRVELLPLLGQLRIMRLLLVRARVKVGRRQRRFVLQRRTERDLPL